jgi:asparagine synthase (glutamine-hydrolysing)
MCGIVGFCDFTKKSNQNNLSMMMKSIYHRGSDAHGEEYLTSENYIIGLGHQRLSILDLSVEGTQPMSFEHLDIVYNGEVYNFKAIKTELEALKYTFHSNSDTEVILKAYHCWGLEALDKFNGMFAMAILDRKKESLTLIRDRAGIKPLYWYWKDGLFLFGSELKSFHQHPNFQKEINRDVLALYLQYGYILQPYSIFESTQQLSSGHTLHLDLKNQIIEKNIYWSVADAYTQPPLDLTDSEAIHQTEKVLKKAFDYRMVSDVPVGVFLSGGYDSSLVTALLQSDRDDKINTFTIGFEEKGYDESPHAKAVAKHLGTEHTEYYCSHADALEIIPKLAEIYDEPFADDSAIPTILVSQLAREKVTVSLSADGGDEIFAGYDEYAKILKMQKQFQTLPDALKKGVSKVMTTIPANKIPFHKRLYNFETRYEKIQNLLLAKNPSEMLKYRSELFTEKEINNLLIYPSENLRTAYDFDFKEIKDNLSKLLLTDYQTYMADNILTKVDRATMSVGLEGREPFLDKDVIEFASQLPSHFKYRNGEQKWILKQITHKYIPKKIMNRPKMGFAPPLSAWFRYELNTYFLHYLSYERLTKEGYFNANEVVRMRQEYLSGKKTSIKKLWSILMFQMWHEKWM